jgi:restriction system protein
MSTNSKSQTRRGRLDKRIPSFEQMMVPTVQALQELGGSGTTEEIYSKVINLLHLPEETLQVMHLETGRTEVEYRLAWTRTYLRKVGLIENSARGVWALTDSADIKKIDPKEIVRRVREASRSNKPDDAAIDSSTDAPDSQPIDEMTWQDKMHKHLLSMPPDAFERLAQRLLRESGFIQVEVTGKSGDGGIDGIGIARLSGFLSFHVLFQCKRIQSAVTPSQIRDFRGAMQGRTDKGLFITTGTFTRDAIKEATRDGAPPIDLIDGEELVRRLKDLGLGVKIQMVESVEVDTEWFNRI